ncbi:MAG: UspA protein [Deltaproteobacteria bacterium]|nr:UspA protein [Deltaproteobacteria bacterium]
MLMPTRILVPTDFSEYSDKALRQALDIAKQYHAKVFLLHVVHEEIHPGDWTSSLPPELEQAIREHHWADIKKRLQDQLNKFPEAKEVEVATVIREGIPYEKILEEGEEKGIDLVVIASLGRSGIAKYLIGSVARNVLKGSQCPVLLTK